MASTSLMAFSLICLGVFASQVQGHRRGWTWGGFGRGGGGGCGSSVVRTLYPNVATNAPLLANSLGSLSQTDTLLLTRLQNLPAATLQQLNFPLTTNARNALVNALADGNLTTAELQNVRALAGQTGTVVVPPVVVPPVVTTNAINTFAPSLRNQGLTVAQLNVLDRVNPPQTLAPLNNVVLNQNGRNALTNALLDGQLTTQEVANILNANNQQPTNNNPQILADQNRVRQNLVLAGVQPSQNLQNAITRAPTTPPTRLTQQAQQAISQILQNSGNTFPPAALQKLNGAANGGLSEAETNLLNAMVTDLAFPLNNQNNLLTAIGFGPNNPNPNRLASPARAMSTRYSFGRSAYVPRTNNFFIPGGSSNTGTNTGFRNTNTGFANTGTYSFGL